VKEYLDIAQKIIDNGEWKDSRAGRAKSLPNVHFEFYSPTRFPLLTARRMPIKSIAVELEGFIKGITSKKWYQERGCRFWDNWANRIAVVRQIHNGTLAYPDDDVNKKCDDLGPMGYGYQWRHFGQAYDEDDDAPLKGHDQLANLVKTLKTNPNDRRMVVSYWNPNQLDRMALPPCTVSFAVNVTGGKLNLSWYQRSCDWALGGGADIASMALMQNLLCCESGFEIGILSALFVDCHIYEHNMPAVEALLQREPRKLPGLCISHDGDFSIFKWTHEQLGLIGYDPHPKLDMGDIAV